MAWREGEGKIKAREVMELKREMPGSQARPGPRSSTGFPPFLRAQGRGLDDAGARVEGKVTAKSI